MAFRCQSTFGALSGLAPMRYNLEPDPDEMRDVAGQEATREVEQRRVEPAKPDRGE